MYLTFLAAYLITCFNYAHYKDNNVSNTNTERWNSTKYKYKDLNNKLLPDLNICERNQNCLVKCCGVRQYLDSHGICRDGQYFKDIYYEKPRLSGDTWESVMMEINYAMFALNSDYTFIQRTLSTAKPNRNFNFIKFYLLENGSLNYTKQVYSVQKSVIVDPLSFCVDHRLRFPNGERKLEFVFELETQDTDIDIPIKPDDKEFAANYGKLGAGIVTSLVLAIWLVYRLRSQLRRRYLIFILGAYFCSLLIVYVLKMIDLTGLETGVMWCTSEYQRLSAPLYYFLLSAFCWSLALTYDLLSAIRNYKEPWRVTLKVDILKFLNYCIFGWGVPLLLTILALVLNKSDLFTWFVENPPFDSCFQNEQQTMLYVHIPISILGIFYCLMIFIIYTYGMWITTNALWNDNIRNRDKKKIRKRRSALRSLVWRKLFSTVILTVVAELVPDVPLLLHIVLYLNCISFSSALFVAYLFKKIVPENIIYRYWCHQIPNRTAGLIKKFHKLKEIKATKFTVKDDKIAIISNNNLEKGNEPSFVSNKSSDTNLTIFYNIDLGTDK